jgi:hypothetical protein
MKLAETSSARNFCSEYAFQNFKIILELSSDILGRGKVGCFK